MGGFAAVYFFRGDALRPANFLGVLPEPFVAEPLDVFGAALTVDLGDVGLLVVLTEPLPVAFATVLVVALGPALAGALTAAARAAVLARPVDVFTAGRLVVDVEVDFAVDFDGALAPDLAGTFSDELVVFVALPDEVSVVAVLPAAPPRVGGVFTGTGFGSCATLGAGLGGGGGAKCTLSDGFCGSMRIAARASSAASAAAAGAVTALGS